MRCEASCRTAAARGQRAPATEDRERLPLAGCPLLWTLAIFSAVGTPRRGEAGERERAATTRQHLRSDGRLNIEMVLHCAANSLLAINALASLLSIEVRQCCVKPNDDTEPKGTSVACAREAE